MSHTRTFRLMDHAIADQRSRWWNGEQARLTVPTFLQEEPSHERNRAR